MPEHGWRRAVERLGPYQSLILLAVPLCIVEPLKLAAVAVAGKGHWITGTGMIIAAYAMSIFVVEKLFLIVKPQLLKLAQQAKGNLTQTLPSVHLSSIDRIRQLTRQGFHLRLGRVITSPCSLFVGHCTNCHPLVSLRRTGELLTTPETSLHVARSACVRQQAGSPAGADFL